MNNGQYSSFNPYFILPFLIWMVLGAITILLGGKEELFFFFNGNHTPFLDTIMPYVTWLGEGGGVALILFVFIGHKDFRNWWYIVAAASCTILASLLTQVIKSAVGAPRPLTYFTDNSLVHILPEWKHYTSRSFPSGHTCGAFAMFFLLSCLLPERYRKLAIVFFFLALSVGYSRMYLGAHFFADVYAGSLVGVGLSAIMLLIMRHYQPRFFRKKKVQG